MNYRGLTSKVLMICLVLLLLGSFSSSVAMALTSETIISSKEISPELSIRKIVKDLALEGQLKNISNDRVDILNDELEFLSCNLTFSPLDTKTIKSLFTAIEKVENNSLKIGTLNLKSDFDKPDLFELSFSVFSLHFPNGKPSKLSPDVPQGINSPMVYIQEILTGVAKATGKTGRVESLEISEKRIVMNGWVASEQQYSDMSRIQMFLGTKFKNVSLDDYRPAMKGGLRFHISIDLSKDDPILKK